MDPCKDEAPKVIDQGIIKKCIEELFPKGEAGRLTREEGIPLDDVQEIRIEFLRIVRIDHLWPMTALTKLSLSNNLIEKIENLNMLVNLVELDLSFNKIEIIENLEDLVNIEVLSVFENLIEILQGMDTFKKLAIFSAGRNNITDRDQILYLRQFRDLKSVNLAGNPCTEQDIHGEDFRQYVVTMLPQIRYYEYRMVLEEERSFGNEFYKKRLEEVLEAETELRVKREKEEREAAETALYEDSFVEFLGSDYLFQCMFENDPEGKALLLLEEAPDYYNEYKQQFLDVTKQIFEIGQQQYVIRKNEVDQFMKCVETAKAKNQHESIDIMEEFVDRKKEAVQQLQELQELADNGDILVEEYQEKLAFMTEDILERISTVWKSLMKSEIILFEQMEETNSTFEHTIQELMNQFLEASQGYFSQMRLLETTYIENITEAANRFRTQIMLDEDIEVKPGLIPYISNKEDLNNALAATHDVHLQIIDAREDRLVGRAKGWLEKLVSNLQQDEIERSRMKVLDINYYLDLQKEEFEKVASVQVGVVVDPDMVPGFL